VIQGGGYGYTPDDLPCISPQLTGYELGDLMDGVILASDDEVKEGARNLAKKEGIFCGFSSGANVSCCLKLLEFIQSHGSHHSDDVILHSDLNFDEFVRNGRQIRLVCLLPDSGMKYLSTSLYQHSK